jgi:hypothetical protein
VRRALAVAALLGLALAAAAWRLADVKPDPNVQALADGCQRDGTKLFTGLAPNWVYVNDRDFPANGPPPPPRVVTGVVKGASGLLASRVSSSDNPLTHVSFDFNIDVAVDSADDFLTGTSRDQTAERGTIHTERESGSYPLWALPQPGDRVEMLGSWVWDCDHYRPNGEKTEFHPWRVAWVTRHPSAPSPTSARGDAEGDLFVSTDATPAGREAECAHQTKGSAAFKPCSHSIANWLSVNGSYDYSLCAPQPAPAGAQLVSRVVDRGSVNAPRVGLFPGNDGCASVRFAINAPAGMRVVVAKQIFLGWSKPVPVEHLRLHFDQLLVRRAMDPSCPPDRPSCRYTAESTRLGQIATPPGEWQLTWSVDGIWGRWPGTLAARDGSVFTGKQSVDFYVRRGTPWTLVVLARECDFGAVPSFAGVGHPIQPCPASREVGNILGDDYPGAITVSYRDLGLGRHVTNASTAGSTCPASNRQGCYQLTYTVSRVQ